MPATVTLEDLEHALYWVSCPPKFENAAYLSRTTGRVYSVGPDGPVDPDTPDDLDDGTEYIAVPSKADLDLGTTLVMAFVAERAPHLAEDVNCIFRQRGAFRKYKALLERLRMLESWHAYERQATSEALARWCTEQGFTLHGPKGAA